MIVKSELVEANTEVRMSFLSFVFFLSSSFGFVFGLVR